MIPDEVIISGHSIVIEPRDNVICGDSVVDGLANLHNNMILYKFGLAESVTEKIVSHEIIHFLMFHSGMDVDEELTERMESAFYQFLKINTNFFDRMSINEVMQLIEEGEVDEPEPDSEQTPIRIRRRNKDKSGMSEDS